MNQGGEQGQDDYGLPRVDIEIPDDARELYRDVLAYHRELRAMRRHQRSMRWRAPFRRSGVAIPLLAGCLVIALVVVMVSAMFTANPYVTTPRPGGKPDAAGRPPGGASSPAQPGQSHQAGRSRSSSPASGATSAGPVTAQLPRRNINVAGRPVPLRTLLSTALAIVPANCGCGKAVAALLRQAESARVLVYLVGPRGSSVAELNRLANSTNAAKSAKVATDNDNVLTSAYQTNGFTVLLVDSHGTVTVAAGLGPNLMLKKELHQLLPPAG